MANENEWLWEVEDEPLSGQLSVDKATGSEKKTALDSEDAVKAIRTHLNGRSDEAIKMLATAAAAGQHLDEIFSVLGQIQFDKGRFKEAAGAWSKLIEQQPGNARAHANAGVAHLRAQEYSTAAGCFERALSVDANQAQARLGLAFCQLQANDTAKALDNFNKYLASGQDHPAALLGKAVCLHRTGKLTEAVEAYRRTLQKKADCQEAIANLIGIGLAQGDAKLVREFLDRLTKLNAKAPAVLQATAALAIQEGKFDHALRNLSEAVKANSSSWQLWFNLGYTQLKLNKRDDAVKSFTEAAKLNPEAAEVHANLGLLLAQKGDVAAARKAYEQALKLAPGDATTLWNLALLAEEKGDKEEAGILLSEALQNRNDWADGWFRLGCHQVQCQDRKGAIEAFSRCLKIKPDWPEARINLASSYLADGKKEDALAVMEDPSGKLAAQPATLRALFSLSLELRETQKAVEYQAKLEKLGDRNPEIAYNLGWLLHDVCRYEEAIEKYRRALEWKPGFAEAELNLGHALKSMGKDDEAKACFDHAIAAGIGR